MSLDTLVRDLEDFRQRWVAKRQLVSAGERAIPVLHKALASPHQGVWWTALTALGEIGTPKALAVLAGVVEDERLGWDARQTLIEVAGQDHGSTRAQWSAWLAGDRTSEPTSERAAEPSMGVPPVAGSPPTPASALRQAAAPPTPDDVIGAAASRLGTSANPFGANAYLLRIALPEGRGQLVRARLLPGANELPEMWRIDTECGPATENNYDWALHHNATLAVGALSVEVRDDNRLFILRADLPRQSADPDALVAVIHYVAAHADAIEKSLVREDSR